MNVDEALLLADEIIGSSGAAQALHVLADEVRRQHAEIERMRERCALIADDFDDRMEYGAGDAIRNEIDV